MVNIQGMTRKELATLESRLRGEIAKAEKKREKTRRQILAIAKRSGFTLQELFDVSAAALASGASLSPARAGRFGRPSGSGARPAPKSISTTKPAKNEVSAEHVKMAASLPTKAAMIRALLPYGYARRAIAAALGTSYNNVYQVEKASKVKAMAKPGGSPKASAKSRSKPAERAVSEIHKAEVRGLPTIAAKVRGLLPYGYSRNAIAAALGTTYQNVYQAGKASKAKAMAKSGGSPKARAKPKSKPADRTVSDEHKTEVRGLPTMAAKIRALLPYGYSRGAIAAALGTTYQNVYQAGKASKAKAKAKPGGSPKADAKTKSKAAERAVSDVHKAEVGGLPTISAKVRALLPHGYSRNAIAAALGTTYQNVYQAGKVSKAKAKAKPGGKPGALGTTRTKASPKAGAKSKSANGDVSADHKGMIKNMPSAAAKVRALLPHGYSRSAIAAAVGKTYQYVYQVEHAPQTKSDGK